MHIPSSCSEGAPEPRSEPRVSSAGSRFLCSCSKPGRAEQEARLQELREEWESQQLVERESLERKQQLALEEMKLAMEEARQKEMNELEQQKEQFLSELRERLEREKKKVRSLLALSHSCSPGWQGSAKVPGLTPTCRLW